MANNRLYIVDTKENEYLCIAKGFSGGWRTGNLDLYSQFISSRDNVAAYTVEGDGGLIIGTENDELFYKKWIENGINFNKQNKWEPNGKD